MALQKMVKVGAVGCGRVFGWAHMKPYLRIVSKANLVGFYDIDRQRAEDTRDKYCDLLEGRLYDHPEEREVILENINQLKCYDSLEDMLKNVDAIDVCTSVRGHIPSAVTALNHDVHSMIEKPMARTWIEAKRAADAFSSKSNTYCQLNDDNLWLPVYNTLHDMIKDGVIGQLQTFWLGRGSKLTATSVLISQANALESGGGCLMDYGSHGMAAAWYVLGMDKTPIKVEAMEIGVKHPDRILQGQPYHLEVEDDAHIKVLFEDPDGGSWITVFLEATWCGVELGPHNGYFRLEGSEGRITSLWDEDDNPFLKVEKWDGQEELISLEKIPGESLSFEREIEEFIDHIIEKTPPIADVAFGADIIAIVGAGYMSGLQKRAVTMEEFKDFSLSYIKKYGDGQEAEEAILADLMEPYRR